MIRAGIAEYVTNGESKILVSNQIQQFIVLIDGTTNTIEGPVYQHEIQRAARMCIDKASMELYFTDVSTRPLCIQVHVESKLCDFNVKMLSCQFRGSIC